MNSVMILGCLVCLSTLMISLMNYENYHTLTVQTLLRTAEEEYVCEGLRAYGEAYYFCHKHSLIVPCMFSPKCPISKAHAEISLKKVQDVLIVEVFLKGRGSTHEGHNSAQDCSGKHSGAV